MTDKDNSHAVNIIQLHRIWNKVSVVSTCTCNLFQSCRTLVWSLAQNSWMKLLSSSEVVHFLFHCLYKPRKVSVSEAKSNERTQLLSRKVCLCIYPAQTLALGLH